VAMAIAPNKLLPFLHRPLGSIFQDAKFLFATIQSYHIIEKHGIQVTAL
jgi:hypothetical protein